MRRGEAAAVAQKETGPSHLVMIFFCFTLTLSPAVAMVLLDKPKKQSW